jgi:hypothetical protein
MSSSTGADISIRRDQRLSTDPTSAALYPSAGRPGALAGGVPGGRVAPEAVVEHRIRVARETERPGLTARGRLADGRIDERGGSASRPRYASSASALRPTGRLPVASPMSLSSSIRRRASVSSPAATWLPARKLSANCSCTSAPDSRASLTCRTASACLASSPRPRARARR